MQSRHPQHQRLLLTPGVFFVLVIILGLAACAPGGTAASRGGPTGNVQGAETRTPVPTASAPPANQGTLTGDVVAGPTCPVERAEDPCPPAPVPGRNVMIEAPNGQLIATATTDKNGHFSLALAPGAYIVQVAPGPTPWPIQRTPVSVKVIAGQVVYVKVELDSGIR